MTLVNRGPFDGTGSMDNLGISSGGDDDEMRAKVSSNGKKINS